MCFLCKSKKSSSNTGLSVVSIGKYRQITICKKSHLTNPNEEKNIATLIDKELEFIKKNKDDNASNLYNGSELDEDDSEEDDCCGFLNLDDQEKCINKGKLLYFETEAKEKKYFCKTTHLIRYLVVYYYAHGKKPGKK